MIPSTPQPTTPPPPVNEVNMIPSTPQPTTPPPPANEATTFIESVMPLGNCSPYGAFGTSVTASGSSIESIMVRRSLAADDSKGKPIEPCSVTFLQTIYDDALKKPTTSLSDLTGSTITPGTYNMNSITISGTVTLSAPSKTDQFLFVTSSTLTTYAGVKFVFLGLARAENVNWAVGGSVSLAKDTSFTGNVVATGSITVGDNVNVVGRLLSTKDVIFGTKDNLKLPNAGRK
jgi:Ice-binding-like